ncbi:hypothetical protein PsYK624_025410 [Phanerochaete sordida]|uniref:Uncharacterized protein n=1 Tax=Phanerochaete sordida TaxID=48140 RepID=A0A9P3G1E8_9APHY|nr:hypothetical protein PsYK624_025410 [Phanerochaete sordida]
MRLQDPCDPILRWRGRDGMARRWQEDGVLAASDLCIASAPRKSSAENRRLAFGHVPWDKGHLVSHYEH